MGETEASGVIARIAGLDELRGHVRGELVDASAPGYKAACRLGPDARGRHHLRSHALLEHDRHPLERDESAQLSDELLERLVGNLNISAATR